MGIEYDAIFLFQLGVGIANMALGAVLFLNAFTFYYLGLGIYSSVVTLVAGVLLAIWVYGHMIHKSLHVILRFASADQITSYMQPLFTIILLNAALLSIAFYLYTITPASPYNSGFAIMMFSVGAVMISGAKVPPKPEKEKKAETHTPVAQQPYCNPPESSHYDIYQTTSSYNDNLYHVTQRTNMSYPSTPINAKSMEERNITEQTFSL